MRRPPADFGKVENPCLEDYINEAVNGCLKETGVAAEAVDKAWIGNFAGELFSGQGHLGAAVVGSNEVSVAPRVCDPAAQVAPRPPFRLSGAIPTLPAPRHAISPSRPPPAPFWRRCATQGLMNKPCMRVEGACASGGLAFTSALESIRAGSDVCLVVGAEVQTTVSARQSVDSNNVVIPQR